MSLSHQFGQFSEELAARYLKEQGYRILETNYRAKYGEIDIIAEKDHILCFVEVKARQSLETGDPFEAITSFKKTRLKKAALQYMSETDRLEDYVQFDVVGITDLGQGPEIELRTNVMEFE